MRKTAEVKSFCTVSLLHFQWKNFCFRISLFCLFLICQPKRNDELLVKRLNQSFSDNSWHCLNYDKNILFTWINIFTCAMKYISSQSNHFISNLKKVNAALSIWIHFSKFLIILLKGRHNQNVHVLLTQRSTDSTYKLYWMSSTIIPVPVQGKQHE